MIKVVWGAPCSGKSTYVKEHFKAGDLRYDFDELKQCIGMTGTHEEGTEKLRKMLLALREKYVTTAKDMNDITAWLICTRPSEFIRNAAGDDAEYIYMDVSEDECMKRLEADDTRPDKKLMADLIHKFFEEEKRSMAIKADREYRNIGTFEQDREDFVFGYASTFDAYEMYEIDGEKYYERIDRHAFDDADMTDVVFLRDHTGAVLARSKNNSIQLWTDEHGLATRTNLSLTEASRAMLEDIKVGNYTQMSFSFVADADHYERDTHTRVIDRIKKVYDISAVAFPANPYTDIGISARDYFNGVIEAERTERFEAERREKARKALALRIKIERAKNGNCRNED